MYPDGHLDEGQLLAFDCDSPRLDLLFDNGDFQFDEGGCEFNEGRCEFNKEQTRSEFNKEPTSEHCVCARG